MVEARVFNFSAGPSILPVEILEAANRDLLNWQGTGMSVMEMSHRSKAYDSIHKKATQDLRDILQIPDNYKVIFMQGGASLQFACVPLNLLKDKATANYLTTGIWTTKAIAEAKKYCEPTEVASGKSTNFTTVPDPSTWSINPEGAYFHYCSNETIQGLEFELNDEMMQKIGDMPVVADMSSNFLSRPIDWSKHSVVYAGAQKNAGPSGVTVVIAREDLLGNAKPITPTMCDWKTQADADSMYNTPPCWSIYMCGLYFDYIKKNGGIAHFNEVARRKAQMIYDFIESSNGFYSNPVNPAYRSLMNIPFHIKGGNPELDKQFLSEAEKQNLTTLAGHRSVGGLRASVYNGMPVEGCQKLVEFMRGFQNNNQ